MNRNEFLAQVGTGAAALLLPACFGMSLSSCSKAGVFPSAPTNVDFTVDVASGALAIKGGYISSNGLIVAHTLAGTFLAVSAACTHQGSTIGYIGATNSFRCPSHGATFNNVGKVTGGPASQSLATYNTTLTGTSLRVFS